MRQTGWRTLRFIEVQLRNDSLSGVLLDRSEFRFELNSSDSFMEDFFHPNAMLTLTLLFAGDHNRDGSVDAAASIVWRKRLGTTYTQDHYHVWCSHFGQTAAGGSAASGAIPEPATTLLLLFASAGGSIGRRTF